jgi:L-ascorbate metabolism protein UlaG (beta-lactamase superfamily)
MIRRTPGGVRRYFERAGAVLLALLALVLLIVTLLWRDRVVLDDIGVTLAPTDIVPGEGVTVTWFGVTTLLFDDGDTQILIDGFVSRPSVFNVVLRLPVENDVAVINRFLHDYGISRLAVVVPVHSHYDHAMDVGAIANRTNAVVLGSGSTAQIALGAGVPQGQILVAEPGTDYDFGRFTVRLIRSVHAPVGWNGSIPLPGEIDRPVTMPAPVTEFREGTTYSVLVSHPAGEALIQGSAGILPGTLAHRKVDTVFLGVGMLESLGRDYIGRYWQSTVTATGARTVIPVHFDDYTQAFGTTRLAPKILDDFSVTLRILKELQHRWDKDTRLYVPVFGVPLPLLPEPTPET